MRDIIIDKENKKPCSIHLIQTQIQFVKVNQFSFVKPLSGNTSLPFLFSPVTWIQPLRLQDLSGPHFDILKPCLWILYPAIRAMNTGIWGNKYSAYSSH